MQAAKIILNDNSELNITFQSVWQVVSTFFEADLVRLSRTPQGTSPR